MYIRGKFHCVYKTQYLDIIFLCKFYINIKFENNLILH